MPKTRVYFSTGNLSLVKFLGKKEYFQKKKKKSKKKKSTYTKIYNMKINLCCALLHCFLPFALYVLFDSQFIPFILIGQYFPLIATFYHFT